MQNQLIQFDALWESFITAVKGSLRMAAKENKLDYDHAKSILAQQALCWQGDFESEGRWIADLINDDPQKGKLVRKILTQDMQFQPEPEIKNSIVPQTAGAVGGGAIGYGIAALSGFGTLATIGTTVATFAIGGIVGNNISHKNRSNAIDDTVEAYTTQLDTYYHSVVSALNA